ncbi:MAG: DEAD/DEAH box helicase [Candidatus Pacearchaeota archaeon]
MLIKKEKNDLILEFDYNPYVIEIVKQFDNRKFNAKEKTWSVPIIHVKKVLETLTPLGFSSTQDVLYEYRRFLQREKTIERILTADFKESEKELLDNVNLPLFPFQRIGVGFLCATKSSLLGDEPGLGKSIQALSVTRINQAEKVLIVCPSTLKLNWKDEILKWFPEEYITVITGSKKQREELWKKSSRYFIMNYELLLKDIETIKKNTWKHIISDESVRISNPKAKQSKLIKTIKAEYRTALTGTPFNNAVQDIWNILDFCQPNLLGSYWQFMNKYCIKDRFGGIVGYKNLSDLKIHLAHYMLRRKKEEVLTELPEKMYETIYIELSDEEKMIYDAIKDEIAQELQNYQITKVLDDKHLKNILVRMIRLKQAADSMKLISEHEYSSKTNALKELLKDIMHDGDKALIFTQFAGMAEILINELQEYNPLLIAGKVKNEVRQENVKAFQKNDTNRILVSTDAGGIGLNLFRAKYVIHFDLPWSIAKLEQREDRAHRIGQENKVTVYKLIVQNTMDEYVLKTLHKKQKMIEDILGEKEKIKKAKISKRDIKKMLE